MNDGGGGRTTSLGKNNNDDGGDNEDVDDEKVTFQDSQTEAVRRCEAFWHFAVGLQPLGNYGYKL